MVLGLGRAEKSEEFTWISFPELGKGLIRLTLNPIPVKTFMLDSGLNLNVVDNERKDGPGSTYSESGTNSNQLDEVTSL